MQWCDLTLSSIEENLALDEALLLHAEDGGPELLRFWEWQHRAVVLGAAGRVNDDVFVGACANDNVPIVRRASGGGTVLLDRGCLIFSLVLNYDRAQSLRSIPGSYGYILQLIQRSLAKQLPDLDLKSPSDMSSTGCKFSGNSQKRKRHSLLHHGTILYDFPIENVGKYLKMPQRQPKYRGDRPHDAFLVNLPLDRATIVELIREAWRLSKSDESTDVTTELTEQLVKEKYSQNEWTYRR